MGARVFSKCENPKLTLEKSRSKMSQKKRPSQLSEYGTQMLEKQKAKYMYGIRERQLANYVKKATAIQSGNPAESLFKKLESRLDTVVYQLGFAKSHAFARQLVGHGHIWVNGRTVTIPSYETSPQDVITIRPQSKNKKVFENSEERLKEHRVPAWLSFDATKHEGKVLSAPITNSASETLINLGAILEFYSR